MDRLETATEEAYWTLGQVVSWIMVRNLQIVSDYRDDDSAAALGFIYGDPSNEGFPAVGFTEAIGQLLHKLGTGDLTSSGRHLKNVERQEIPSVVWADYGFAFMPDGAGPLNSNNVVSKVIWTVLRFPVAEVVKLWPSLLSVGSNSLPVLSEWGYEPVVKFAETGWYIGYGDECSIVPLCKGMKFIAFLLQHPGVEYFVMDLERLLIPPTLLDQRIQRETPDDFLVDESVIDPDSSMPMTDEKTIRDAKARIMELNEDLKEARAMQDEISIEKLTEDLEFLEDYILANTDHKGRPRGTPAAVKKAVDRVRKNINESIKLIRKRAPNLAEHLNMSLERSTYLKYNNDECLNWCFEGLPQNYSEI